MKKTDPNAFPENGESKEKQNDPNREDPGRPHEEGYSRFVKDKRKRIVRAEKNPKPDHAPERNTEYKTTERRSYNPNFTSDNRKVDSRPRRTYERDFNKPEISSDDYFNSDNYHNENNNRDTRQKRQRVTAPRHSDRDFNRVGYEERKPSYDHRPSRGYTKQERSSEKPYSPYGKDNYQRGDKNRDYGSKPGYRDGSTRKPDYKRGRTGKPFAPGDNYPKYPSPRIDDEVRLNRFLSMSGICSRREADELIAAGKVTVNGKVITELGTKIKQDDLVTYNGKVLKGESMVYIVMNKPKGYVTTLDDPHAEKTVMDLLKNSVKERVYPVGRLDKNSLGVLLITNDGDMTKKLTHPTYAKKKIYQVSLDKALTKADMQQIADGITLDDGEIHADSINYINENHKEIGIEIHSGRNRIIRRIFEHLGYQVRKLDRVYFAGLTKKNLKRGAWRFLTPQEVAALHSGRYE